MNNEINIGENIRTVRTQMNLSQEAVSSISGIERAQISRIESNVVDPQVSTVLKIAEALKIDAQILLKPTTSLSLHPFVKWAGGKTQLLEKIVSLMPENFNSYFEPFVGGGALFFRIQPKKAFINDANSELISAYECFKKPETFNQLINKLNQYQELHSEDFYIKIRALDRENNWSNASIVDKAARMIYLNKACFNGLFRVNSKGFFNVPSGKKKHVNCYSLDNFNGIKKYFENAEISITNLDFEDAVKQVQKGDFVYFDPPYDTWEDKNSFTSYDKEGFGKKDQKRLADVFKRLNDLGAFVMLSNHNTKYIRELYEGFAIHIVNAKRMINSKADGRGDVEEVLITNYEK